MIETVKEMMERLLYMMGMKAEVEAYLKEEDLFLDIRADERGILIGKHGQTLDALQFLLNRMVNKQLKEGVRVYIDVNGYKRRRTDTLTQMAVRLGEKARRSGKAVTTGPFNPHDRRIIHMALKNDPAFETESLGEGEMKRIKIIPKSMPR